MGPMPRLIKRFQSDQKSRLTIIVLLSGFSIAYFSQRRVEGENPRAVEQSQSSFDTKSLPKRPNYSAPDGSAVRLLVKGHRGSMAHFELDGGHTSKAVAHKTVEEIWYFLSGRGEMWRKLGDKEEIVSVHRNVSISIPKGTRFQFRSLGKAPLEAVAVTMPPWPGAEEAYDVTGKWPASEK